jgi:hypothetical protein
VIKREEGEGRKREELRVKSEVLYLCKIVDTIRNLPFSLFPLPALSSSLY